jgi:hypothetical protein
VQTVKQIVMWPATLIAIAFVTPTSLVHSDAPAGQYELTNETVKDLKTGLIWQRIVREDDLLTYTEAQARCAAMGVGWRLPTPKQLLTLVDPIFTQPAIDREAFPNTPADIYWTSLRSTDMPAFVWTVSFFRGTSEPIGEQGSTLAVRCVR